ncbi:MAG: long-chain fatty acid--CoA ligase [Marinospirillum sp.]|uniref:class I adenylate-forming enzyme family protein n=1 Tax=Marinospirillum sp. TaxID=2183934 RepID=UPI001A036593|nr:long-chain fatty acid--CoA ligase [Marinospirillum sp.]MBE0506650.1 long-chain fatty acid--CoA ligase [Marinospirillum sp.]
MEMFDLLAHRARQNPDHLALEDLGTGERFTYGELNKRASRIAQAAVQHWALKPGDRIAWLGESRAEFFALLFACGKAGLILVPLNWRLAQGELLQLLEDCSPVVLIHTASFRDKACDLQSSRTELQLLDMDGASDQLGYAYDLNRVNPDLAPVPPSDPDRPWYLLYTSGTTGRPKGVVQTFRMMLANYLSIGTAVSLASSDVLLNVLPLFHTSGINLYSTGVLFVGGTVLVAPTFDPDQTLEVLEQRATVFFGVPAIYQALLDHPDFDGARLRGVRSWSCGGAALSLPVAQRYVELGIKIRTGYGMTETGPSVFLADEDRVIEKIGSVGRPLIMTQVRLVDPSGCDVEKQQAGELLVRGPGITPGYWQQPDATTSAFTADGWLRTGDIARCDADGFFTLVDRSKDMFISGGENVYPAEIEKVLLQHPLIREVAVIGVPDSKWGEVGKAFIICDVGEEIPAPEDLRAFCSQHLATYKIPASFVQQDHLPRNAMGKITKQELRHGYR